ncbi:MAG TPA: hypothetical protein VGA61_04420 [Anaerolineae bacterium]
MSIAYCTLDDVKHYGILNENAAGNLSSGRDDALLTTWITEYSRHVDDFTGWHGFDSETLHVSLSGRPWVSIDSDGRLWVQTLKPVVTAVASLTWRTTYNGGATAVDPTRIFLAPDPSPFPPIGRSWAIGVDQDFSAYRDQRLWLDLTFTGGYGTIPGPIHDLTMELVFWTYKLRESVPTAITAFPAMDMAVRPLGWPPHIKEPLLQWQRVWH